MPRTRINCPNCRQPIAADIDQLFDVGSDPGAKQRLLSGAFNMVQCPHCGYQGNLATPVVYHDPEKELLMTFIPPEINLPRNEAERLIGQLINQVVNNLPQEKRKAYLLRPQSALTLQGLIERVLEGEGITREMIQEQQKRLNLIQRLLSVTADDVRAEMIKQEDRLVDAEFFTLLRRLGEASVMGGDQESARQLSDLQQGLLEHSTFGKELQSQSQEVEAAVKELQSAGRELDRARLLEMVVSAPNETRQRAFVSLARPVMDYNFFTLLTDRINQAKGDQRSKLEELRGKLLEWTREVDRQMEARSKAARDLLEALLEAEDIEQAMMEGLPAVDDFFIQALNEAQDQARKQGDLERLGKLQKVVDVLQQLSSAPPEMALIEELLDAPDEAARRVVMEEHRDEITPDFISALASIAGQVDGGEDRELAERIHATHRQVLRFSMEQNLKK